MRLDAETFSLPRQISRLTRKLGHILEDANRWLEAMRCSERYGQIQGQWRNTPSTHSTFCWSKITYGSSPKNKCLVMYQCDTSCITSRDLLAGGVSYRKKADRLVISRQRPNHVLHGTNRKRGKDTKTRCIGSIYSLLDGKDWSSIKQDRIPAHCISKSIVLKS